MKLEVFLVRRFRAGKLEKVYGPFAERDAAELVAQRASEKHRASLIIVEPVTPRPRT